MLNHIDWENNLKNNKNKNVILSDNVENVFFSYENGNIIISINGKEIYNVENVGSNFTIDIEK